MSPRTTGPATAVVAAVLAALAVAAPASAHIGETAAFLNLEPFDPDRQTARQMAAVEPPLEAVPRAVCGPGAREETGIQGRVSRADHDSGLAAQGLRCNAELVGQHTQEKAGQDGTIVGSVGGYKVFRYEDDLGNECAYYDTSLLPPTNAPDGNLGVRVLDMNDPENPRLTGILSSPAMAFPHESLTLSEERGLLMAVAGNLSQALLPGQVDIYDLNATPVLGCAAPVLVSSTPLGIWGHEGAVSPDGNTFFAASFSTETITALDISNPLLPLPVGQMPINSHGLSISDDGNTMYVAKNDPYIGSGTSGLGIYDISEFQAREVSPSYTELADLTWTGMSIPQSTVPITIDGHPFVIESDEFGPGASRIIDIEDPRNPFVVSNLRLEVHQSDIRNADPTIEDDPGVNTPFAFAQDYTGHFCNVPTRVDPPIVACGMSVSGLRVFNIEDPYNPYEVAYFTAPVQERAFPEGSNWAYSQPTFSPERKEVWYSESYTGFYAVRLTNGAWPDPDPVEPVCTITGTEADDVIVAPDRGDVADVICGLGGNDVLKGFGGDDILIGGPGADTLVGGPGADTLDGGGGRDVGAFNGAAGAATGPVSANLAGAEVTDDGTGSADTIITDTEGNATIEDLRGGDFNDTLLGDGRPNRLDGEAGADTLSGAGDNDRLLGRDGFDTLAGGPGNDILYGDAGGDTLLGEGGDDRVFPGTGNDFTVNGGAGTNQLRYNDISGGGITLDLAAGTVTGAAGDDTVVGPSFAKVIGTSFADVLVAVFPDAAQVTTLIGLGGADTMDVADNTGGDTINAVAGQSGSEQDTCRFDRGAYPDPGDRRGSGCEIKEPVRGSG